MTHRAGPGSPSEQEVRSLVERVLEGVVGSEHPADSEGHPDHREPAASGGDEKTRIAIGADHGGYPLKEKIGFKLKEAGYEVLDCGTNSHDAVDYPDFAHAVAREVASGACRYGIVVDGAGIGSAMVANKVPGVRAALCYDLSSARNSREHNHANVLTLGAGLVGDALAWQIVEEWLSVEWGGDRHARRVAKIDAIERQYSPAGMRQETG
ncbi:MAG TPA: ribose 5-phosphate isomerase B [Acidimicrobiia bacterium]|nr:ribose 5-phosphate isomerase B [Acidimicrobiia bacterium]